MAMLHNIIYSVIDSEQHSSVTLLTKLLLLLCAFLKCLCEKDLDKILNG